MDTTKSTTDPKKTSSGSVKPAQQGDDVDQPPTFGRSAILMLVLALAIYAYQVNGRQHWSYYIWEAFYLTSESSLVDQCV